MESKGFVRINNNTFIEVVSINDKCKNFIPLSNKYLYYIDDILHEIKPKYNEGNIIDTKNIFGGDSDRRVIIDVNTHTNYTNNSDGKIYGTSFVYKIGSKDQ